MKRKPAFFISCLLVMMLIVNSIKGQTNSNISIKTGYSFPENGVFIGVDYCRKLNSFLSIVPGFGYLNSIGFKNSFTAYSSFGNKPDQPYVFDNKFARFDGIQSSSITFCIDFSPFSKMKRHKFHLGLGGGLASTIKNFVDNKTEDGVKYISELGIVTKNSLIAKGYIEYSFLLSDYNQLGCFFEIIGTGFDPTAITGIKYTHQLK
jgi:hypothetical protein